MAILLIDTDVFSYLTSSNPNRAAPYRKHLDGHTITLSFVTVGEQYAGYCKQILKGHWPAARLQTLEANLKTVIVIPYDMEVCRTYGDLRAITERSGHGIADNDLWIAACAKRHSLKLVTNNRSHFKSIPGLDLISEAPGAD
jgi:tRNA(fMet)-specific endonuclease VapC